MDKIIVLSEWRNSSVVMVIILACITTFLLTFYLLILLIDKKSHMGLLVFVFIFAILLWVALNNCIQHRGEVFQKIAAPTEVTEQQLQEKYNTVKFSQSDSTPENYNCWIVSFKQVD